MGRASWWQVSPYTVTCVIGCLSIWHWHLLHSRNPPSESSGSTGTGTTPVQIAPPQAVSEADGGAKARDAGTVAVASSAVLPPAAAEVYTVGKRGGSDCPAGSTRLMDDVECNTAAVVAATGMEVWGGSFCYDMSTY